MEKILYEDNHLIVITKPVGMLSQSDVKKQYSLYDSLKDYLKQKTQKDRVYLAIVHRLDRNTGGIMIFAKTSKAASRLSEQFRNRTIQKKYLVVTADIPRTGKKGKMINYMQKNEKKRIAMETSPHHPKSKLAELEYDLIEEIYHQDQKFYKFLVHPLTGRFHQIRFQFAYNGAPLIGDRKYGRSSIIDFPAIWSYEIIFKHPTLKTIMHFKSTPPENWPF